MSEGQDELDCQGKQRGPGTKTAVPSDPIHSRISPALTIICEANRVNRSRSSVVFRFSSVCCLFFIPRQARVLGIHKIFTVKSFEPAHREVGAGDALKVRNERVVYDSAAHGADDGNSLGTDLFCDDKSEAGCHLRDEAHARRPPFVGRAWPEKNAGAPLPFFPRCAPGAKFPARGWVAHPGAPPLGKA